MKFIQSSVCYELQEEGRNYFVHYCPMRKGIILIVGPRGIVIQDPKMVEKFAKAVLELQVTGKYVDDVEPPKITLG